MVVVGDMCSRAWLCLSSWLVKMVCIVRIIIGSSSAVREDRHGIKHAGLSLTR